MALRRMPLTIGGVDFSALTERLGYSITYEERRGGNTTTMQNGDEYIDLIVRKPVLTWRLDSITNADLARLHAAINADTYVNVTYFDTARNRNVTAAFHGSISEQEVGVIRGNLAYRFKVSTLTMRAR